MRYIGNFPMKRIFYLTAPLSTTQNIKKSKHCLEANTSKYKRTSFACVHVIESLTFFVSADDLHKSWYCKYSNVSNSAITSPISTHPLPRFHEEKKLSSVLKETNNSLGLGMEWKGCRDDTVLKITVKMTEHRWLARTHCENYRR